MKPLAILGLIILVCTVSAYPGWDLHWYPYNYGNLTGEIPQWINESYLQGFINNTPTEGYTQMIQNETTNQMQDDLLGNYLCFAISQKASGDNRARIAISMVKHLPTHGTFAERAVGPYQFQYPYVSFGYTSSGVCSDRSIALSWLLSRLGYDSAVFWFQGGPDGSHMAPAVRVNSSAPYNFNHTGYARLEISDPAVPTEADVVDQGSVTVFKVGNGTGKMNLDREWVDGQRWAWLNENYHTLTAEQYKEFSSLVSYYDSFELFHQNNITRN